MSKNIVPTVSKTAIYATLIFTILTVILSVWKSSPKYISVQDIVVISQSFFDEEILKIEFRTKSHHDKLSYLVDRKEPGRINVSIIEFNGTGKRLFKDEKGSFYIIIDSLYKFSNYVEVHINKELDLGGWSNQIIEPLRKNGGAGVAH